MKNIEHFLKKTLKRRLKITQSLVVTFLIMGTVLQAAPQEDPREEKKVLIFMNGMIQDGGGSGSHQKVSKRNKKPDRPIVKPITPEVDPQRPIDGFDPITPGIDPQRPIDSFDPITPEIKPQRPIDDFDPITPEVDPASIIIWENGEDIRGTTYTLSEDLSVLSLEDGLRTTIGEIINEATIAIDTNSNSGMRVLKNGTAINKGNIAVNNAGSAAMVSENGGTLINEGTISNKGGMIGRNSTLINEIIGNIFVKGIYLSAMEIEGGEAINKGTITLLEFDDIGNGISVSGEGTGTNEGVIEIYSKSSKGMWADDENSTVINEGAIIGHTSTTAMDADNGTALNKGTINNSLMKAGYNGTAINEKTGTITIDSDDPQSAMSGRGGEIINKGIINTNFRGIALEYEATGTNEGSIIVTDSGGVNDVGIESWYDSIAFNKGEIKGEIDRGMEAAFNSTAINENLIEASESAQNPIGMFGSNSTVLNKGIIILNSDGMYYSKHHIAGMDGTGEEAILTNEGTISVNGQYSVGMKVGQKATAINEGTINVNGVDGIGIQSEYWGGDEIGTTVINKGTININADNGIGIHVSKGGNGINEETGVINLNADNGIGIKVDEGGTYVNNGEINIKEGTLGNQEIVTEVEAKVINLGSIVAEGELDTGEGKFIMSSGGTLEADSIKSDIYASGALARGNFEDTYSIYKMLKTNNLEGDVISNSAMFDAKVTESADENGYYDVELVRKDFNSLMVNGEVGEILEDNYQDTGNDLKEDYYDALKLLSSEKGLNQAANDTFGIGYFGGIAKQSLDTVKTVRNVIKNNIFTEAGNRPVGGVIAIGGMNASTTEIDGSGNLIGYDYDLYSMYFGADKQLTPEWRIGALGTVGKGEADYDNANDKSDDMYQGTFYALYEGDFKVNTMLYLGQIDSDLERNVNFADWNKKYEDKTNTKFIGLDTAISKRYNLNNFYIEPKAELNTTYFKQDGIQEQGEGGVSIDSQDYYSIETGIGGAIGRSFLQEKLAIEGSMMFYTELGDPYKDQESKVNGLFEGDKVKINSYQGNDYYADLGLDMSYKVIEPLKINLGGSYITGEEEDNWNINIGLKYVM